MTEASAGERALFFGEGGGGQIPLIHTVHTAGAYGAQYVQNAVCLP